MWRLVAVFFVLFSSISCEDVVDIDVPGEDPRLIIDALIRVDESQDTFTASVKVGLTSSFFEAIPVTGLTDITIINLSLPTTDCANCLILEELTPNSGIYEALTTPGFFMGGELILQLTHEGRLYFASTEYIPAVPIDSLEQGTETLFDDEETEIIVTFTDAPDRDDYYIFDFNFGEYLPTEDTFYKGQEFSFSYFYDQLFEPGTELEIKILGADQAFYNYMNLLVQQSDDQLDIFSTPVATLRGNIFDVTDLDNMEVLDNVDQPDVFPLGYFAVVQEFSDTITIQ